jgi:hypothetical protein
MHARRCSVRAWAPPAAGRDQRHREQRPDFLVACDLPEANVASPFGPQAGSSTGGKVIPGHCEGGRKRPFRDFTGHSKIRTEMSLVAECGGSSRTSHCTQIPKDVGSDIASRTASAACVRDGNRSQPGRSCARGPGVSMATHSAGSRSIMAEKQRDRACVGSGAGLLTAAACGGDR